MRVLYNRLHQTCVYWGAVVDAKGEYVPGPKGQPQFIAPVQLRCRWVDENAEFIDRQGNAAISRAVVYLDQPVIELGVLWQGVLTVLSDPQKADPFKGKTKAWEVRRFNVFPGLRNNKNQYKAFL